MNVMTDGISPDVNSLPNRSRVLAEGKRSIIEQDPADARYCFKIPNQQGSEAKKMLLREKKIHDALVHFGIPTTGEYEVQEYKEIGSDGQEETRYRARMTNLSYGGNLVVSTPDTYSEPEYSDNGELIHSGWTQQDLEVWTSFTKSRPAPSSEQVDHFLASLKRDMLEKGQTAKDPKLDVNGIRIAKASGYFFIIKPNGEISTVVSDYEDGVNLKDINTLGFSKDDWRRYVPIADYLASTLSQFYPQYQEKAWQFISELTQGQFPRELFGETNPDVRGKLIYGSEYLGSGLIEQ